MIRPMLPSDVAAAADLVCRVFLESEPTSRALGLTPDVFLPFCHAYCAHAAEEGTGVVAGTEGRLVGAATCLDLLEDVRDRHPELHGEQFAPKLPDMAFVARLEGPYVEENALRPGQCAHIAQVAVAPGARGQGLATALLEEACRAAAGRGYDRVVSLCTGPGSRRAHEKAGFQVDRTLRYDTYLHEGRRVFADVPGECALLVRRLEPAGMNHREHGEH